jgi:hypothetical protein
VQKIWIASSQALLAMTTMYMLTQFSPNRDRHFGNAGAKSPVLLSDDPRVGSMTRRRQMTTFKFFSALAILSALNAAPALAQHMIDEPGMYAFYHPNGDPNVGSAAPADSMAMDLFRGNRVMMQMKMRAHPAHLRR